MSINQFLGSTGSGLSTSLTNISPAGKQYIVNLIEGQIAVGVVEFVNEIAPVSGNVSIDSDQVPEGTVHYYLPSLSGTSGPCVAIGAGSAWSSYEFTTSFLNTTFAGGSPNVLTITNPYHTIASMQDVTFTSLANGQIMQYSTLAAGWVNVNLPATSPLTTNGDIYYYNGGNTRLPIGGNNQILQVVAGEPSWVNNPDIPLSTVTTNQDLIVGTGASTVTRLGIGANGSILYVNSSGNLAYLPIGSNGQIMNILTGLPHWITPNYVTPGSFITYLNSDLGSLYTVVGGILAGSGVGGFAEIVPGANNTFLVANSTATLGLSWDSLTLASGLVSDVVVSSPSNGSILVYNTSTSQWKSYNPPNASGYYLTTNTSDPNNLAWNLLYLQNCQDCYQLNTATNGQVLTYSSVNGWYAATPSAGSSTLAALTDVSLSSLTNNQLLQYNSGTSKWANAFISYSQLSDVQLTSLVNSEVMIWNSTTSKWNNVTLQTLLYTMLSVNVGSIIYQSTNLPTGIQALTTAGASAGYVLTLQTVSGNLVPYWAVSTGGTLPWSNAGDMLYYNSSPQALPIGTSGQVLTVSSGLPVWATPSSGVTSLYLLSDVNVTEGSGINGYNLQWSNGTSKWIAVAPTLAQDTDVAISSPSNLQALTYNSTLSQWNNTTLSVSGGYISDLNSSGATSGSILRYNGTNWVSSNTLTTDETNISNLLISVANLNLSNPQNTYPFTITQPMLQSLSQGTYPIGATSFYQGTVIIPLNGTGGDATGSTTFLNYNAIDTGWTGPIFNGTPSHDAPVCYKVAGYYPTQTAAFSNYLYAGSGIPCRLNVNYVNNGGISAGLYTFICSTNSLGNPNFRVYGLKNASIVTSEMSNTSNTYPTTGSNYDLVVNQTVTNNSVNLFNVTTTSLYYMLVFFGGGMSGTNLINGMSVAATVLNNDYLTITTTPGSATNTLTLSNVNGVLNLNTQYTLRTDETIVINSQLLNYYYATAVLYPVVRSVNSIYLNNTQYTDTAIAVNNSTQMFHITDSSNNVILDIDATNHKVIMPYASYAMLYDASGTSTGMTIATGSVYGISFGTSTLTSNPSGVYTSTTSGQIKSSQSGTYKCTYAISFTWTEVLATDTLQFSLVYGSSALPGSLVTVDYPNSGNYMYISKTVIANLNTTSQAIYIGVQLQSGSSNTFTSVDGCITLENLYSS